MIINCCVLPGLPNCVMLHKNLMVAWESFPPQLTIQVRFMYVMYNLCIQCTLGDWSKLCVTKLL